MLCNLKKNPKRKTLMPSVCRGSLQLSHSDRENVWVNASSPAWKSTLGSNELTERHHLVYHCGAALGTMWCQPGIWWQGPNQCSSCALLKKMSQKKKPLDKFLNITRVSRSRTWKMLQSNIKFLGEFCSSNRMQVLWKASNHKTHSISVNKPNKPFTPKVIRHPSVAQHIT